MHLPRDIFKSQSTGPASRTLFEERIFAGVVKFLRMKSCCTEGKPRVQCVEFSKERREGYRQGHVKTR